MKKEALGILEVQGYSVALAAMDKACKSANIKILAIDCNNPSAGDNAHIPLVVQVKFVGSVSDVKIALEIAVEKAMEYNLREEIITEYIAAYHEDLEKLITIGKVNNKQV